MARSSSGPTRPLAARWPRNVRRSQRDVAMGLSVETPQCATGRPGVQPRTASENRSPAVAGGGRLVAMYFVRASRVLPFCLTGLAAMLATSVASAGQGPALTALDVLPPTIILDGPRGGCQLIITGRYADGS